MKKVLIWETLPIIGGGQKISIIVAEALANNFEVEFLIPREGELSSKLFELGIKYEVIGDCTLPIGIKKINAIFKFLYLSFVNISRAVKSIKKRKPDILYVPGPMAMPWGVIAGKITGVPVIWHIHHMFEDAKTLKLLNYFSKSENVRGIFSVSECVANQINSSVGKKKIHVLYNPVDYEKYSSGIKGVVRKEFRVPESSFVLSHIGILQEQKKQDLTVRAVARLVRQGHDAYGLIVGQARQETREYAHYLKILAKDLSIEKRIILTGHRSDVNNVFSDTDAVIVAGTEGFSLIALEAMAAGKPIIAVNQGGVKEIVNLSKGGLLFRLEEAETDIENCVLTLSNFMVKNELVSNGKMFALLRNLDSYKQEVNKLFGELLTNF